jgi:hypothetical protein
MKILTFIGFVAGSCDSGASRRCPSRQHQGLLLPQKQTSVGAVGMPEKCQKRSTQHGAMCACFALNSRSWQYWQKYCFERFLAGRAFGARPVSPDSHKLPLLHHLRAPSSSIDE